MKLLLKDIELLILLKIAGIDRIAYYKAGEISEADNIPYVIHEMVRKGILWTDGEQLRVNEPHRTFLLDIRNKKGMLTIYCGENLCEVKYIFLADDMVLLEDDVHQVNGVRIGQITEQDLLECLYPYLGAEPTFLYPDEFEMTLEQEKNLHTLAKIVLVRGETAEEEKQVREWCLIQGRYKNYIKDTNEFGMTTWSSLNEWNVEDVLFAIWNVKKGA